MAWWGPLRQLNTARCPPVALDRRDEEAKKVNSMSKKDERSE
jgi:hypothetical protein